MLRAPLLALALGLTACNAGLFGGDADRGAALDADNNDNNDNNDIDDVDDDGEGEAGGEGEGEVLDDGRGEGLRAGGQGVRAARDARRGATATGGLGRRPFDVFGSAADRPGGPGFSTGPSRPSGGVGMSILDGAIGRWPT